MFKTDTKTLEYLSFRFNEKDISILKALFKHLKSDDLLTMPEEEVKRVLAGLDSIGRLKLDGKVYGFHVDDSYAERQSGQGWGVELFLRQGDRLEEYFVSEDRCGVWDASQAADHLKKQDIYTIYTGNIKGEFLGLDYERDIEDPIKTDILEPSDIGVFESEGINVVVLNSLI